MATPTQGNLFQKPQEGLDDNTWGTTLNTNLDTLAALLSGNQQVPALDVTGDVRVRGNLRLDKARVLHSLDIGQGDLRINALSPPLYTLSPPTDMGINDPIRVFAGDMVDGQVVDLLYNGRHGVVQWNQVVFADGNLSPGPSRDGLLVRLIKVPGSATARGFVLAN